VRTLSKTILVFVLSGCGVALAKAPEPATAPAPTTTVAPATTSTSTTTTTTVPPTTTTTVAPLTFTPLCPEAVAVARKIGWPLELLERLDQITWRESRCDPLAWNRDDPGTGSRGLMQINSEPWCRKSRYNPHPAGYLGNLGVLETCDDLFIPEVNMTAALHLCWYSITRHGHCWHPWKQ